MRYYTMILLSSSLLFSNDLRSSLSLQGFTGLMNTPNAQVLKEGTATFHYGNQFNNHLRSYNYENPQVSQEDFMVGMGVLSDFEIVARLTEVEAFTTARARQFDFEHRDLSANFKYKLPYEHRFLPSMALGLQDVGGSANMYTNYYVALDKEIGFLRTSLGYGKSGENKVTKRMDGIFGGLEAKATDWASILLEHDGKENHAALRLSMPKSWTNTFKVDATLAQNLTEAQTYVAVNVSLPLFHDSKTNIYQEIINEASNSIVNSLTPRVTNSSNKPNASESKKEIFHTLQENLVAIGFENVQVGSYRESIYVKCENNIFDHTDLDALGYILGTLSHLSKTNRHFIVTLLKNNLQILSVSGNSQFFNAYVEKKSKENELALKNNLDFSRSFDEKDVKFITSKQNSSRFKPRLELSPGLITPIGTEIGLFDYIVALRVNAYTNVYDGLTLSAMYEMPLVHSENFNDDRVLGKQYQNQLDNRLVNLQLHQTVHYESFLNTTSVGRFRESYNGILNHTNLTSISGEHGIGLRLGNFEHNENKNLDNKNVYIGTYRHFYAPLDLYTELSYGQYWYEDQGATLQFKRFFGETEVALYVKNTENSFAGFRVSLPLTTRKSTNYTLGQIKGKKDFNYGVGTMVGNEENFVTGAIAVTPKTDLELTTHYLDRNRLNASYIKEHLDRMREAYLMYGVK